MATYNLDPAVGNCGYQGGTGGLVGTAGASVAASPPSPSAFILAEGCATWETVGASNSWSGSSLRFYATNPTQIQVQVYQGFGGYLRLFIDGVYQSSSVSISGSGYGTYTVPGTLPTDGLVHEFRVAGAALWNSLIVTGGTVRTTPILPWPVIALYGDSRTAGVGVTDTSLTWNLRIAGPLNMQVYSSGVSSSTMQYYLGGSASQTTDSGEYRTDNVLLPTKIWPNAKVIISTYGINDYNTYVSANFIAGYTNLIQKLLIGNTNAIVVIELPYNGSSGDTKTLMQADILTAINNVGSSQVHYKTGMYDTGLAVIHADDAQCATLATAVVTDVQSVLNVPPVTGAPFSRIRTGY